MNIVNSACKRILTFGMIITMLVVCKYCGHSGIPIKITQGTNMAFRYDLGNGDYINGKKCRDCHRVIARKYYKKNDRHLYYRAYEKTIPGFLMRIYRNMKSRITGVQKKGIHLYKGKYLLPKEEFYKWANESKEFHRLFKDYEASEYARKLAPSVDRIDSSKGYYLTNMEWVTHSENSRRGSISQQVMKKKAHHLLRKCSSS